MEGEGDLVWTPKSPETPPRGLGIKFGSTGGDQHVCGVCKRGFSSGKALGGHMRVHNISAPAEKVECDINHECALCDKQFSSIKALFGHMRCHPDRVWRGVRPPVLPSSSSGSSRESPPQLPNWPLTAKRSRASIGTSSDEQLQEQDPPHPQDALQAAYSLLYLSRGETVGSDQEQDSLGQGDKKKKQKLRGIGELTGQGTEHKCITCGRYFPTHQALGGHRSSIKCKPAEGEPAEEVANSVVLVGDDSASSSGSNLKSYSCLICHKPFPTGQALGGHMRLHYNKPVSPSTAASNSVASKEEEEAGDKKVFDIDLNELPVLADGYVEEEAEDFGSNGIQEQTN